MTETVDPDAPTIEPIEYTIFDHTLNTYAIGGSHPVMIIKPKGG